MAAEAHLQREETREAVRLGEEALARAPENDFVLWRLANYHLVAGDLKAADRHVRQAIEIDPEYADYWTTLGEIALAEDDRDGARRCAERAVALAPEDADALHLLARTQKNDTKDDVRAALPRFEAALAANPDDAWIWADKAEAHLRLKQVDEAEDAVRTALSLEPTNARCRRLFYDVLKRRSWVYRILRWPGDLVAKGFGLIDRMSWPVWILLCVVGIGTRFFWLLLGVGAIWLTFCFPVLKLHEWLTTADLRRKAREIEPVRRGWWRVHRWPVPVRVGLFLAVTGAFWYGSWRWIRTPGAREVLATVLAVGVVVVAALSLFGLALIVRDKRRARRRREAIEGRLSSLATSPGASGGGAPR